MIGQETDSKKRKKSRFFFLQIQNLCVPLCPTGDTNYS